MAELPSGTVTFLLTDVEGSTARWEKQPDAMAAALTRHDALIRAAIIQHDGSVVKTMGDAFHAVFRDASDAVAAAVDAQRRLLDESWDDLGGLRVRMALHTGVTEERDGDYYGPPMNRVARLLSIGHGGQILLSEATAALTRDGLPDRVTLDDLGAHRLKDLTRPERVFQLLAPDLPTETRPLASLDARPHNLPTHPTPLIGRKEVAAAVEALLLRDDVRQVTLTGPGGTGKTRLSLQVAADLLDRFEHGAFFIDLAPISDPALVVSTIAQTLGVPDSAGRPRLDVLADALRSRQMLLVLDNFEQVLSNATDVSELLRACPRLTILVTSRAALQIRGEHEYPVPALSLPTAGQSTTPAALSQYAAVTLFIERAVAVKPDFAVTNENAPAVAEICIRLDGLPLAIELAAARIRLLTSQAMLARLERRLALLTGGARDLPARQQTLRGTIAWSYDLLDEAERRLYRRLGVFVGGCTLESAEAIGGMTGDQALNVLDGVTSLVAKSLLRQQEQPDGEPRFTMLETIRADALERLEQKGEVDEAHQRHAAFVLVLAEDAEPALRGPEQGKWLARLEAEHDNLRVALTWAVKHDAETSQRLGGALWRFWYIRGHPREGRDWLDRVLAVGLEARTVARVRALNGAGNLARTQGEFDYARALQQEALALAQELQDREGEALVLADFASVLAQLGDSAAERLVDELLAMLRTQGDSPWAQHLMATTLCTRAELARGRGDLARARELTEEVLAALRRLGDLAYTATALANLAGIVHVQGDHAGAARYYREALLQQQQLGDREGIAYSLAGLAGLAAARGRPVRALRLAAASVRVCEEVGISLESIEQAAMDDAVAVGRGAVSDVTSTAAWDAGRLLPEEMAVAEALALADELAGDLSGTVPDTVG